jgi:hypothetical protein
VEAENIKALEEVFQVIKLVLQTKGLRQPTELLFKSYKPEEEVSVETIKLCLDSFKIPKAA